MIDDESLIAALRLAAGHDRIPDHVAAAARHAYRLRVPGAVTAERVDVPPARGVRSGSAPRLFRFAAPDLTVDVEATPCGGLLDLAGQVTPAPDGGLVRVRTPHLDETRRLPSSGRFAVTGLPFGWFSVVVDRSPAPPVVTAWTRFRP
ncbi:hypothetical protein [Thermostaphylospora chromogena]|uniref:Uncharacterized protein n=1 Tax=Thermostaphylospora chromogena TaxID=35622 RepID=A0A1H1I213_9ACTN|nr:hypothetical protein [Thermostaphylospora chromogena]SDR31629.1 hypothetical protein SAMN04489764_5079 [Thermostaphylospora chromogena]